jgi:hypothetical protein
VCLAERTRRRKRPRIEFNLAIMTRGRAVSFRRKIRFEGAVCEGGRVAYRPKR